MTIEEGVKCQECKDTGIIEMQGGLFQKACTCEAGEAIGRKRQAELQELIAKQEPKPEPDTEEGIITDGSGELLNHTVFKQGEIRPEPEPETEPGEYTFEPKLELEPEIEKEVDNGATKDQPGIDEVNQPSGAKVTVKPVKPTKPKSRRKK